MGDRELTGPKTGLRWADIVVAEFVGLSVCEGLGLSESTRGVCTVRSSGSLRGLVRFRHQRDCVSLHHGEVSHIRIHVCFFHFTYGRSAAPQSRREDFSQQGCQKEPTEDAGFFRRRLLNRHLSKSSSVLARIEKLWNNSEHLILLESSLRESSRDVSRQSRTRATRTPPHALRNNFSAPSAASPLQRTYKISSQKTHRYNSCQDSCVLLVWRPRGQS